MHQYRKHFNKMLRCLGFRCCIVSLFSVFLLCRHLLPVLLTAGLTSGFMFCVIPTSELHNMTQHLCLSI
jgi:hypothetical protein